MYLLIITFCRSISNTLSDTMVFFMYNNTYYKNNELSTNHIWLRPSYLRNRRVYHSAMSLVYTSGCRT